MLFDSVRSLVMCNLFSHALCWSAWPAARSGFLFTLNMSEAEVRLRTMTDANSCADLKNWTEDSTFWLFFFKIFLLMEESKVVFHLQGSNQDGSRSSSVWIQIMSSNLA